MPMPQSYATRHQTFRIEPDSGGVVVCGFFCRDGPKAGVFGWIGGGGGGGCDPAGLARDMDRDGRRGDCGFDWGMVNDAKDGLNQSGPNAPPGHRERIGWVMRANLLALGLVLLVGVGCAPTFSGQWLEDKAPPKADMVGVKRDFVRMALDFDPISSVRVGIFNETAGVVDDESVQLDQYFTFDGGRVAQFGAAMARLESNEKLTANVAGTARTFMRVKGKGIFPPIVRIPPLTQSQPQTQDRYANASP